MKRLEGKIAIVTGGSSGMGRATAKQFVAEGAIVIITGRRQDKLDKTVTEIGGAIEGIQSDIANLEDLERLRAHIRSMQQVREHEQHLAAVERLLAGNGQLE